MKLKAFFKNKAVKNILSALAIIVFGFILLNIAFMFDFLFQSAIMAILKLFIPGDLFLQYPWFPPVMHVLFLIVIGLISWIVFNSKLKVLLKAIYMNVPLAVVFMTIGMFFYPWPLVTFLIGGLFFISVLYYLYRTKQPWLYYFSLIFIGVLMLLVVITGVEI